MKTATKLTLFATLSLLIGIAVAAPLFASEINIRPFTNTVQGPTADFDINVVYANFTVQNPDTPLTRTSGPTINYFAVVNVTNPSAYQALLIGVDFWAGQKITNTTGQPMFTSGNWSSGGGWEAKGAWVDGKWYNVSYVNDQYPYFDENGTMHQSMFTASNQSYWIEGVQVYERTVHNDAGTNTYTYLNMNGTWTDVTGRITVDKPVNGPSYSMNGCLAQQNIFFQNVTTYDSNLFVDNNYGYISTKNIWANDKAFNNHFAPQQSRLIAVYGNWEANQLNVDVNPVQALQSGKVDLKTMIQTFLDTDPDLGDHTFLNTGSDATVIQQLPLTHSGNSYIYNTVLSDNQIFSLDQYGVEAFITQRS